MAAAGAGAGACVIVPDECMYSAVMNAMGESGAWAEAVELLQSMRPRPRSPPPSAPPPPLPLSPPPPSSVRQTRDDDDECDATTSLTGTITAGTGSSGEGVGRVGVGSEREPGAEVESDSQSGPGSEREVVSETEFGSGREVGFEPELVSDEDLGSEKGFGDELGSRREPVSSQSTPPAVPPQSPPPLAGRLAYGSACRACARQGKWREVLDLIADMREDGLDRDASIYAAVMRAFVEAGEWEKSIPLVMVEVRATVGE